MEDGVPVRRQQADGDAPPAEPSDGGDEELEPDRPIAIVQKIDGSGGGAGTGMLDPWSEVPRSPRHRPRIASRPPLGKVSRPDSVSIGHVSVPGTGTCPVGTSVAAFAAAPSGASQAGARCRGCRS